MLNRILQGFFQLLAGNLGSVGNRGSNVKVAHVPKTISPNGSKVDFLHEWISLPLHDEQFREVFKKHEDSIPHLTNWLFMNERLQKVNMMGDVPGMSSATWRNNISLKHHDPKPITHDNFTAGKVQLGITFNDSAQWRYRFPAKTFRTVTMGGITSLQLGGADVYVNTEQRMIHNEELLESVNAQTIYHYRARRPVVRENLKDNEAVRDILYSESANSHAWVSTGLSNNNIQKYIKEIGEAKVSAAEEKGDSVFGNIPLSIFNKKNTDISNGLNKANLATSIPNIWDERDDLRDTDKPRSQVWHRYEGVVRWEAVQTDPTKAFVNNSYQALTSSTYSEGNNAFSSAKHPLLKDKSPTQDFKNPALTKNSPQVLLEIRPQDIQPGGDKTYDGLDVSKIQEKVGDDQAKLIMASPQFIFVGAENPGTIESNGEATAYEWSGTSSKAKSETGPGLTDELSHDRAETKDNIFAVSAKKDINKCWLNALPEKPIGSERKAMNSHFGILGGEKLINSSTNAKKPDGKSGLELFGREALLLGAGIKPENKKWNSSVLLYQQGIKLETKEKVDDKNETIISMESKLLELKKKVDDLESLITMDQDGITFSVNDKTKIKMGKDKISFTVEGVDVGDFNKKGWLGLNARSLTLGVLDVKPS